MNKELSPLKIKQIKTAAKRLKSHLPDKSHTELLDIVSHQLYGFNSYRDAVKASESILKKRSEPESNSLGQMQRNITWGQKFNQSPTFKSGDWYFYPEDKVIVFDGEFTPYMIGVDQISNSLQLLDFILQIQKKKWPIELVKSSGISPTYQVDEFIELINQLCIYYFEMPIQGVFSPFGHFKEVQWSLIKKDEPATTEF
ncbi:hypothetical protein [Pseudoalteromonas 'SMAR']|uniref:hypothetical protein n=1 Tax=Pseudoalteromonas 'SMAR' TaxID=3416908 RepID=UPI003AF238E0